MRGKERERKEEGEAGGESGCFNTLRGKSKYSRKHRREGARKAPEHRGTDEY